MKQQTLRDQTGKRQHGLAMTLVSGSAVFCTGIAIAAGDAPSVGGIPVDFMLFATTLLGVAVFHHYTLQVALTGLATITVYKFVYTGFKDGPGLDGLLVHLQHEWVILTNLLCLLVGLPDVRDVLKELLFAAKLHAAGHGEVGIVAREVKAIDMKCPLIEGKA